MSNKPKLRQRRATFADAPLLYRWANDPDTRRASFHQRQIYWSQHLRWLSQVLKAPNIHLYIVLKGKQPVATYRLEVRKKTAVINLSVAPQSRGQGIGGELMNLIIVTAAKLGVTKLMGEVKIENQASLRLFQKTGFIIARHGTKHAAPFIRFEREVQSTNK